MISEYTIRGSDDDHEEASFTLVVFPKAGYENEISTPARDTSRSLPVSHWARSCGT